jgi:hypothetical protein
MVPSGRGSNDRRVEGLLPGDGVMSFLRFVVVVVVSSFMTSSSDDGER